MNRTHIPNLHLDNLPRSRGRSDWIHPTSPAPGCSKSVVRLQANLIPFAATHPLARMVGIDLSQVHIDQGRRRVRALGLDNIELVHGDVAHLDLAAVGQFDFIICRGVYSWVPDEVQEAILAACGQLFSPAGVAYVGYSTQPGWKAKEIVRDTMLLSAGDSATIDEKGALRAQEVDLLQKVA